MAEGPKPPTPDATLLVVDDDPAVRGTVSRALRRDARVIEAANAEQARDYLITGSFDLVITDIGLPDEDGLQLMRWAREQELGGNWIVLTGLGTFDTAVEALKLGAFDFITKPVSLAALKNTARNALDHKRLRDERDRLNVELEESNRNLREHVEQLEAACNLLRENDATMRADLIRAGLIQQALLPRVAPQLAGLSVAAVYRPSQSVGGDLYDVVRLDDRHVVLLIADAAGHGLSAAMLAVLFRHQLPLADPCSREPLRPAEALAEVNRLLCAASSTPGLFVTAVLGLLDLEERTLQIASAGHTPTVLRRARGDVERLFHTGPALGLYADAAFTQQEVRLDGGDRLLLHTDGAYDGLLGDSRSPGERLAEWFGGGERQGAEVLSDLLGRCAGDGAPGARDDVTFLMVEARDGESKLDNGILAPLPAPAGPTTSPAAEILVGGDAERTTLAIEGRGDWIRSAAFHDACAASLEEHRPVMVDLTLCEHLDSTFLGTIHALCGQAEADDLDFRLQGVMPPVEALFTELGMRRVQEHMVPAMLPLPTQMRSLADRDEDPAARARRLLRAHEGLAALNERNRREFDPLLTALRREAGAA